MVFLQLRQMNLVISSKLSTDPPSEGLMFRYITMEAKQNLEYTVVIEAEKEAEDYYYNFLKEKGIPTSIHYPSLMPDQEALNINKKGFFSKIFNRKLYKSFSLKIAQNCVEKVLSLPMHPLLSEKDQDLIIDSLINANKKINKS